MLGQSFDKNGEIKTSKNYKYFSIVRRNFENGVIKDKLQKENDAIKRSKIEAEQYRDITADSKNSKYSFNNCIGEYMKVCTAIDIADFNSRMKI